MSEATAVGMEVAKVAAAQSGESRKRILVTGGAGYIGSHTTVKLLEAGFDVIILDNLCNSSIIALDRIKELAGVGDDRVTFHKVDLMDAAALTAAVASAGKVSAVVHFAALKAVGESVEKPLKYYENNMVGTFNLLRAMEANGISTIVFSSSATVYGDAAVPITEASTVGVGITNPYGWTKSMMEQVLRDVQRSKPDWRVVLLRYFNPVGAHPSGRIGEDPKGRPNNLMPFVQQVAVGRREKLSVFGNDYDTIDGTGVRDYIHVVDLAEGHLAAIAYAEKQAEGFCEPFNLGTGNGYSVLQMVEAMKKASGREIPYEIVARREGDLATVYAEPTKAREKLGWEAKLGLEEMCADAWRWQSTNPTGFGTGDGEE